ncbi:hypothetical protein CDD83_1549 [Cordyceps sp. RAO-2017]|nr:hypothetical protein CDD83_1549 [Cordyceps sp. RAO-2017]
MRDDEEARRGLSRRRRRRLGPAQKADATIADALRGSPSPTPTPTAAPAQQRNSIFGAVDPAPPVVKTETGRGSFAGRSYSSGMDLDSGYGDGEI